VAAKCPDNEISAAQRSKVGGKTPHNALRNSQGKTPIVSPQILYATAVHIKIVQKARGNLTFGPVSKTFAVSQDGKTSQIRENKVGGKTPRNTLRKS